MPLLVVLLALAVAPAPVRPAPASCVWKEPAAAARLEVKDGAAVFSWPLDQAWFHCARAHGGAMSVTFLVRGWKRGAIRARAFHRVRADATESVQVSELCAAALTSEAQVRVVGTGPMDRLLFKTPLVALPCFRCPRPPEAELAARAHDPAAPAGFVTVIGRYAPAFQKCAAAAGGTLSMRVYVGHSQLEARTRRDHSFVLRGLEKEAAFRKAFAPTNLCREGKWIGVEYFGTGEFRQLNANRRDTLQPTCPAGL